MSILFHSYNFIGISNLPIISSSIGDILHRDISIGSLSLAYEGDDGEVSQIILDFELAVRLDRNGKGTHVQKILKRRECSLSLNNEYIFACHFSVSIRHRIMITLTAFLEWPPTLIHLMHCSYSMMYRCPSPL